MLIKIRRKTYFIPEKWNQVTIAHFKQIIQLKPELLKGDEYYYQLLGIFTEQDIDKFRDSITVSEFAELKDVLSFMLVSLPDEQQQLKTTFILNEKVWAMQHDLNALGYGAFLDLQRLIETNQKNPFAVLDEMLAIIIRPVKKKRLMHNVIKRLFRKEYRNVYNYQLEEYDASKRKENAEFLAGQITMEDAYSIGLFFWAFGKESLKNTSDYLNAMGAELVMKEQLNSDKSTGGIPPSAH